MFDYGFPERTRELERLAFEDAKKSLDEAVPTECRNLVNIRSIVREGDVREELLRMIHDEKIDLVVMGSHGRRNIERFFLGSTTEHMLRKVPVPVLTVSRIIPGREIHTPGPVPIRRIVYAVDLSESAEIGLRYSAELARTFGAALELVHVIDPIETGQWGTEVPGSLPFDLSAVQTVARERLQQIVLAADIEDVKTNISVVEGIPHNTIIRFADEVGADLIVQNLKSKGVLERVMLGATAERVIRASHIPVLSIPVGSVASFMQPTFTGKAVSYRE
jgi:nucleotide-binding universal stress UspA family protein